MARIDDSMPLIFRPGISRKERDSRQPRQKQLAVYFILGITLLERIAFYALVTNLVLTLRSSELLHWDPRHSQTAFFIFSGTSYISTLIFAVISDWKLGRRTTISIGLLVYLIGYTLIIVIAEKKTRLCDFNKTHHVNGTSFRHEPCAPAILGTLICIGVGAGAVKANLAVFGAEQIQESAITSRYFDKYVVAVNIGSMIATLIIPPIQNHSTNHFIGYIIATAALVIASFLFLFGWSHYLDIKPNETVVSNCIPVVINAFRSWRNSKRRRRSADTANNDSSRMNPLNSFHDSTDQEDLITSDERPSGFLDFAKSANGGRFLDRVVDDVKSLRSALLVYTLLIPYWLIYNQMDGTFHLQGEHMKWPRDKKYIVPWMSLGDPVTIIIGILILNIFVYKYFDARTRAAKIITKFVIGMCFAVLTICIAGIVEVFRLQQCHENQENSNLSIFYQLPQNVFMGISELFAMVASYEFAYFTAPRSAQSLFMSLHFCSVGVSSFISAAYIYIFPTTKFVVDFTCPKEKAWSFYVYFFNLAGLQLLFIIIIIVCYKKCRIVKLNLQKAGVSHFVRQSSTVSSD